MAFRHLKNHLEGYSKKSEAEILLDTAFASLRDTPQWKAIWLTDWYTPKEKFLAEVKYHFSQSEWDIALELLNERMANKKISHSLYALRGEAYYKTGSFRAAEADFSIALKMSKRNHNYMVWYAKSLLKNNRVRKCLRYLDKAIALSGGEPTYHLIRATAFAADKDYESAIDDMKIYLSFYPNDLDATAQYAEYATQANCFIDALFLLGKLIKAYPNEFKFYNSRGEIYMKSGSWAVAEMDFDQAIKLDSTKHETYLNRGQCRFNQKKFSEACADWRQAIKLGSFVAQELVYKNCR